MKKYNSYILILPLLFFLFGCKSEGDPFEPKTVFGGYVKWKVNGEDFIAQTDIPIASGSGGNLFFGESGGGTSIPSAAYAAHLSNDTISSTYGIIADRKMSNEPQQKRMRIAIISDVKVGRYSTNTGEVGFGFSFYADTNGYSL